MRKRLILILFACVMLFAGCSYKDETIKPEANVGAAESSEGTDEETEELKENKEETEISGQDKQTASTETTETLKQEETRPEAAGRAEPQQSKPEPQQPKPEKPKMELISYDPASVCSKAIAKCQAGGMITTADNLANLLSEGKITQEEYDSYYPYDGLENSYYSVFVNVDLNEAATTSGRLLGSEEAIAQYIADMLLLESEPVFYIEYAGIYHLNGADFYEFRCHR